MTNKIISILSITIFSISLSVGTFAQSIDEQIESLEKELVRLKEQKIEKHQNEIKKLQAEIGSMKSKGGNTQPVTYTSNGDSDSGQQISERDTDDGGEKSTDTNDIEVDSEENNDSNNDSQSESEQSDTSNNQSTNVNCSVLKLDPNKFSLYERNLCRLTDLIFSNNNQIVIGRTKSNLNVIFGSKVYSSLTANSTAPTEAKVKRTFLQESEKIRTDKQVGAAPSSTGTTSLTVKGGTPAVLGWALESGAATSFISGNTVTVRANPVGFSRAFLLRQGLVNIKDSANDDAFTQFLQKFSVGFTFDTTRGQETPNFIVSKQQLSAVSLRYEFINHRNPLSERYSEKRNEFWSDTTPTRQAFVDANNALIVNNTYNNANIQKWIVDTNELLEKIEDNQTENAKKQQILDIVLKQSDITQECISILECWCYEQHHQTNDSRNERILDWTDLSQHANKLYCFGIFDTNRTRPTLSSAIF